MNTLDKLFSSHGGIIEQSIFKKRKTKLAPL